MKLLIRYILVIIGVFSVVQCARTGSPSGGEQDKIPPKIIKMVPPTNTINFKGNRIRLYFDEYVVSKDIRKQLIISPPLNYFPEITPSGYASKYLDIKIIDTLKPNTTYTINFGNSIQDNNEGNVLSFFKYVFSTGDKIDSLSVKGTILDAFYRKPDNFVNVMLYEVNDKLTDSIVYKEKPIYVTNTLDSLQTFEITNVKAGKYMLVAMKDKANNYVFNQKQDKIAFWNSYIEVPKDTIYHLTLFQEIANRRVARPFQSGEKRISIGYEGDKDSVKIKKIDFVPEDFRYVISKDPQKDTLNIWFTPKIDSLRMFVENVKIDTFQVRFRKMKPDSLEITTQSKSLSPNKDLLTFTSNIPIEKIEKEKIKILEADSIPISFESEIDMDKLNFHIQINSKPSTKYKIIAYPQALTDFYGQTNDTINTNITAKTEADFAKLKLVINKEMKFPILVELTNEKGSEIIYHKYIEEKQSEYSFNYIKAGKYFVRIIEDRNKNKKWDTGDFLQRLQPEPIHHLPEEVDLRPNWEVTQVYNGEPVPISNKKNTQKTQKSKTQSRNKKK